MHINKINAQGRKIDRNISMRITHKSSKLGGKQDELDPQQPHIGLGSLNKNNY